MHHRTIADGEFDLVFQPTTLEVQYLRRFLQSLPPAWRTAVDVGAHRGDITAALADMRYRVLAVEPHPQVAERLRLRFAPQLAQGLVHVEQCAASDRDGDGDLFVGSASTVSTLEAHWTTAAFPREFAEGRAVGVALRRLDELVRDFSADRLGFLKVDVEGHEYPVLRGCFSRGTMARPAAVMFEAFSPFPDAAEQCLGYLSRQGYGTFDIFVRVGPDLHEVERFCRPELPDSWRGREGMLFYANVIAYHPAAVECVRLPEPARFVERYMQQRKRAAVAAVAQREALAA
jgi:FkbM family methyltransferase